MKEKNGFVAVGVALGVASGGLAGQEQSSLEKVDRLEDDLEN